MIHQRNSIIEGFLSLVEREKISELRLHHSMTRKDTSIPVPFNQGKGQKGFCCL